jgi:adiponectin receptor
MEVRFVCLDYAGISLLICGSFAILTYYAFYCDVFWRRFYLTQTISVSMVGIIGPFLPYWTAPAFRWGRVSVYTTSAIASAVPSLHYLFVYGIPQRIDVLGWLNVAFCYLLGSFIYGSRMPERFFPGKLDYLFHSHQIWHVFVVLGAVLMYVNGLELLHWRLDHGCSLENQ